jgi:hypothetical protein
MRAFYEQTWPENKPFCDDDGNIYHNSWTVKDNKIIFKCIIPVVFYANKEGLGPSKHNWVMYYSVYYAHDDMLRPLWAIFRSQNCITKKSYTGYKYKLQV